MKQRENKIAVPILTEMALLRQEIESDVMMSLSEIEPLIRQLNILSVRLYIITHQW